MSLPIQIARLLIRDFRRSDFEMVHNYASDPEVVKFMEWGPNTREQTEVFLERVIQDKYKVPRRAFELAITLKGGPLIGAIGIHVSDAENREGWIGYCLRRDAWGRGYGSEAAKAIVDFGFRCLGLHRIWATCDIQNVASARVLEKAGMTREGHLRKHKWQKGRWRDSYLYAVLEDEFRTAKGGV